MQISYFAMPLGLAGLAVAFKLASDWTNDIAKIIGVEQRTLIVHDGVFQGISALAALFFLAMLFLYVLRLLMYPKKCLTEWRCPLGGNSFAMITLSLMLFAFLLFDQIVYDQENAKAGNEEPPQIIARVGFWIGALAQVILTVVKFGEWIARRLEFEHVHPHYIVLPVGLGVAALIAPMIPLFDPNNRTDFEGIVFIARFFQSFAVFMFMVLFTITFFKVVTTHNSDPSLRHGIFTWLAAPSILGMSEFSVCFFSQSPVDKNECVNSLANYYFIAMFILLGILYSAMPFIGFIGKEKWGMEYWIGCFALDALAGAACLFYAVTDFRAAENLSIVALSMATIANFTNFLHTGVALIRRRGIFVPNNKWGPLSFMKLTHEAFRGNMATMRETLQNLNLSDTKAMNQNLSIFAVHLNRFCILHEEHSKHEDEVIFKVFNDWFQEHAKAFNDEHDVFHIVMADVEKNANILLNRSLLESDRQEALTVLNKILPPFFKSFEEHLKGEEDNLQPIGKKYLPLEIQKQISRQVWAITAADRWEIIIPFVVLNLPRHQQRVRYLKVLLWSMPERAQQVGAIVYRNVDAVMWERLREEVPEMIPRGEIGWWRYY